MSKNRSEFGPIRSEIETERFFTLSLDMLCIASFDGYFTRLNPAWEKNLGWTIDELTSKPYLEFVHPDDRAATVAEAGKVAAGRDVLTFENRYQCKDGAYRWLLWNATPYLDEGLIYAVARDITGRKQAEQILRESGERLRFQERALDSTRDGILITDPHQPDNPIIYCNAGFEQLTGYTGAEILGQNCRFLQGTDRAQPALEEVRGALREHRGCRVTLRNYKKDGTQFWNELTISPVRDSGGQVTHFVGIVRDITRRKQAEDGLNERLRLAALDAEVSAALTRKDTLGEMLHACVAVLVRHLDAAFARIWTVNETGDTLQLQASAGMYTHLDGEHSRVPMGQFKIGMIAAEAKPHLTNQVIGDRRVHNQDWARREGMVAFAGYPLIVDEQVVGVVALFARHELSETVLQTLGNLALGIATGIRRKAGEAQLIQARDELEQRVHERTADLATANVALVDSERQVRVLLDSTAEAIYGLDLNGNCTFANPACVQLLGYQSVDDLLGRDMHQLIHHTRPDGTRYPVHECPIYATFQRGEGAHVDSEELWRADGTSFPAEYWSYPIRQQQQIVGSVVTFLDITERRRAEAAVLRERDFADAVINSLPGVFYVFDQDSGFLRWNKNTETITGYSGDELAKMTPLDFFLEEDHAWIGQRIREVFEKGIATDRADYRFKDGRTAPFFFTGIRFHSDGRPLLIGIGIDVSELHAAETALRQHAKRLEVIGEIMESILSARSKEQIAQAVLGRLENLVPCQRSSVALFESQLDRATLLAIHGAPDTKMQPGAEIPVELFGDLRALRRGDVFQIKALERELHRSEIYQTLYSEGVRAITIFPLLVEGDLVGTLNLGTEQTDLLTDEHLAVAQEVAQPLAVAIRQSQLDEQVVRHAEVLELRVAQRTAELAEAKDRAESADRVKSAFLATMSHELRTPLNSIIGFTGTVSKGLAGPLTDEQKKQLGMVMKSARHLLELINDVLDLSKIEAGQLEVERSAFPLTDALDHCLELVSPLAKQKHLRIEARLAVDLNELVSDRRRVEQIVINLLTNAVKFTDRGALTLVANRVPAAGDTPPCIEIQVIDTGSGIKPEDYPQLFQPFQQLRQGLARPHEGTGLGLSICKKLLELLGGEIKVRSQWGKGSTFTVILPTTRES